MPSISSIIKGWVDQNATHFQSLNFPDPNASPEATPIRAQKHYFRLWLCEMFLTKSRTWFRDQYPVVNAAVQLRFGGVEGQPFTRLAGPNQNALGLGVYKNYPLTALLPFQGGLVEIDVSLTALQGANSLLSVISVLEGFSQLVAPPLGQALSLAKEVSGGVEKVFAAHQGSVHLGFHQTYSGDGGGGEAILSPGYVAVVAATKTDLPPESLSVIGGELCRNGNPLVGFDYLLFRIEGRYERDDWPSDIEAPFREAQEALDLGQQERADAARATAISAAYHSLDLTPVDRRRIIEAIKEAFKLTTNTGGHGMIGTEKLTLKQAFQAHAPRYAAVEGLPALEADELFEP